MLPMLLLIQSITSPVEIDRQVAAHLNAPIGAIGGAERPVDPRLKLARCDQQLALITSARGDSVTVQCPDGWRLFVRVSGKPTASSGQPGPPTVRRGQEVTLRLSGTGFSVSQSATALDDGATGGWVRVRRGRETVRGRVTADGAVELSPAP